MYFNHFCLIWANKVHVRHSPRCVDNPCYYRQQRQPLPTASSLHRLQTIKREAAFEGRYTVDGRRFFDTLAGMKETLAEEEKLEAAKQTVAQATKALIEDEVCGHFSRNVLASVLMQSSTVTGHKTGERSPKGKRRTISKKKGTFYCPSHRHCHTT